MTLSMIPWEREKGTEAAAIAAAAAAAAAISTIYGYCYDQTACYMLHSHSLPALRAASKRKKMSVGSLVCSNSSSRAS